MTITCCGVVAVLKDSSEACIDAAEAMFAADASKPACELCTNTALANTVTDSTKRGYITAAKTPPYHHCSNVYKQ